MIKTQMEMYLHEELETLTRTEIEALQFERLLRTVRRCMKSPFYQKRFAEAHLSPEDIRSLDDLRKIPFTTKQDLRDNYPFGLAAVPMSEVVRLHSSSGTTGTPTVILHTQKDLDEWANAVARCLYMVGLRRGDVFQNSSGYGMFTGGLGFQYGAERLGMLTVPAVVFRRQVLGLYTSSGAELQAAFTRMMIVCLTYSLDGTMAAMSGVNRGLGYSMLSAAVTFVGACVFRIIWVYTVFASVGTLESLYVSYPISWILSTAAHIVCYYIIRKKPFKATLEAKAAAA